MTSLLTLREFAVAAADAVQAAGVAPDNRQAKAVPAERMVRYYTARGLLPRPGSRGRALMYGRIHLTHLVAIKRLQGEGLSLDEIAARLAAMSPAEVEALAAIPATSLEPGSYSPRTSRMPWSISRNQVSPKKPGFSTEKGSVPGPADSPCAMAVPTSPPSTPLPR